MPQNTDRAQGGTGTESGPFSKPKIQPGEQRGAELLDGETQGNDTPQGSDTPRRQ